MGFSRLSKDFYCRWVSSNDAGLTDDDLIFALELMRSANYERIVFYNRDESFSPAEWIDWARSTKRMFFILYRSDGTPLAAAWFSEPSETLAQAFSHFCTFKTGEYREYVKGGRLLLKFLGETSKLRQAIGITPRCYGHALRLAYDLGYVRTAMLEKSVFVHGKDRDAVLTINNIRRLEA